VFVSPMDQKSIVSVCFGVTLNYIYYY